MSEINRLFGIKKNNKQAVLTGMKTVDGKELKLKKDDDHYETREKF